MDIIKKEKQLVTVHCAYLIDKVELSVTHNKFLRLSDRNKGKKSRSFFLNNTLR